MSLDQRSTAILSYLMKEQTYVKAQGIIDKFHISRRTVYSDISKINDWLKENNLPLIRHVRTAGFLLDKTAATEIPKKLGELNSWQYEYSAKERKAWLAIYIITRDTPLFLGNLMDRIRVSRNTVLEDLKGLNQELRRFNLALEFNRKSGYVINGEEEEKRRVIMYFLEHVQLNENWSTILSKIPVAINTESDQVAFDKWKAIQKIIGDSEHELNIQFTDEIMFSLSVRLLLFCGRISQGKKISIDPFEKEVLQKTKQYKAARNIGEKLSALFEIEFPKEEILYLTKHLLGSGVQFSGDLESNNSSDSEILARVVSQMVTDFQKYACVFFKERHEVEKGLLLHIKPAYYRIRYGLEFQSDMTETIKKQYHDTFFITKKVISNLHDVVGKEINDHEIALIALHFSGWMRKVGAKPAVRKKALLVCTNGIGTSRLLLHQLEGLFSTIDFIGNVSLREYEKNQYDADLVISTIPLEEKNKPVFVVSPILTETEKERLLKRFNIYFDKGSIQSSSVDTLMDIINKYANILDKDALQIELKQYLYKPEKVEVVIDKPSLNSLLPARYIQLKESVTDWEEAIRTASSPLIQDKVITNEYIQVMIDNIKRMGPYIVISPKIAIPHASPEDGVNKLGMSLLKISQSVPFSENREQNVQIVIVLAAINGESHLKALSQLTEMLSNQHNIDRILLAESSEDISKLIKAYSI